MKVIQIILRGFKGIIVALLRAFFAVVKGIAAIALLAIAIVVFLQAIKTDSPTRGTASATAPKTQTIRLVDPIICTTFDSMASINTAAYGSLTQLAGAVVENERYCDLIDGTVRGTVLKKNGRVLTMRFSTTNGPITAYSLTSYVGGS